MNTGYRIQHADHPETSVSSSVADAPPRRNVGLDPTALQQTLHPHQVLMISYYYPPVEHTGTRRVVKFVKYLPEFGYQPVILTTRTRGTLPSDSAPTLFEQMI